MRSRRSLRKIRRGLTLPETMVASAIAVLTITGTATVLTTAGVMFEKTTRQGETDSRAASGMDYILNDVREAKEVEVVTPSRFRIYYPALRPDGRYDRFETDFAHYTEYLQADAAGVPEMNGEYLWRRNESGEGRILAQGLKQLRVNSGNARSLKVTLHLEKGKGATRLTERVLYLRNN